MKIFKIISFATIASMALMASAYAENNFSFYENVSINGSELVVEGTAEKEINILILKPDMAVTDNGSVRYAENVTPDEKGAFSVTIPMDIENDISGNYICYVGGAGFGGESKKQSLYFADETDRKNAITAIKNADNITIAIKENKDKLSINNDLVNGIGFDKLSMAIAEDKSILDAENYTETIMKIQQKALIVAYNEGEIALVANNNEFLYKTLVDFSGIDKDGVTLYNAYENILTDKGRTLVIENMCGKNLKTEEELLREFARQVILVGIKNANTDGNGHIGKLITKENAKSADLDDKGYLNLTTSAAKTAANNYIAKESFSAISELENVLKNAVKEAESKPQKPSSGGGGGGGISGSQNEGIGGIIIGDSNITQNTPPAEIPEEVIFTDIENAAWAKEAILNLYEKGIVKGVGDKKFDPQSKVTREQFVVILMRAFNINATSNEKYFDDVIEGIYYEKHVNTAKELGIIKGIGDNKFGVGLPLSRQDLAVMVRNTVEMQGINLKNVNNISFADEAYIAQYAQSAVKALSSAGIINGFEDNTFRPAESCTRAQASKIIYELVKGEG